MISSNTIELIRNALDKKKEQQQKLEAELAQEQYVIFYNEEQIKEMERRRIIDAAFEAGAYHALNEVLNAAIVHDGNLFKLVNDLLLKLIAENKTFKHTQFQD